MSFEARSPASRRLLRIFSGRISRSACPAQRFCPRYEASKNRETFNVTASCASGYKGVPSVTECTSHQSPYSLEGCAPEKCAEPTDAEKDGPQARERVGKGKGWHGGWLTSHALFFSLSYAYLTHISIVLVHHYCGWLRIPRVSQQLKSLGSQPR